MKLGVVMPTRGLVNGEAIDTLVRQLNSLGEVAWDLRMPSDLGIPDCFNYPIQNLLKDKSLTHILIVEDDVVIPFGGILEMIKLESDIACIDYPLANGYSTVTKIRDKIGWCGTGCTLIKREVLELIGYPYFRTDIAYDMDDEGNAEENIILHPENRYGGHDVHFGIEATIKRNFVIKQVEGMTARHIKLVKLGEPNVNKGNHTFRELNKIEHQTVLENFSLLTYT